MITHKEAAEVLEYLGEEMILPDASTLSRPTDLRVTLPKSAKKPCLDQYDKD
jgi:hypothetical protein